MKRLFIISLLSAISSMMFAQLNVFPDGKVSIGISSATTPLSKLAVGSAGEASYFSNFHSDNNTMQIISTGINSNLGNLTRTLTVSMESTASRIYNGFSVYATKPSSSSSGRTSGIIAGAGNSTSGYNHAIVGFLTGSNNGSGIFGSVNLGQGHDAYVDGRYAGFFDGNVKSTGSITAVSFINNSDLRLKQNISELSSSKDGANELKRITSLAPVSYNYKQVYHNLKSDSLMKEIGFFDENSLAFKKKHFGLIAQDLQKIYPDLVYENDNGYLAVNYVEIIPLLIQSIKELKEEMDIMGVALVSARSAMTNDIIAETPRAVLYQNAPNPFTDRTEIKFALPDNAKTASILIFNMQGSLVRQIPVNKQQQNITINGSELAAGMYLYSLVVDGKEVDTKRMILTK